MDLHSDCAFSLGRYRAEEAQISGLQSKRHLTDIEDSDSLRKSMALGDLCQTQR